MKSRTNTAGKQRFLRPEWRWHTVVWIFIAGFLLAAGWQIQATAAAAEPAVTEARVGRHGATTRVVFDLTREVHFRIFTLANPHRVVLDVPHLAWQLLAKDHPRPKGLFRTLRHGQFQDDMTRIVLECSAPALIDSVALLPPTQEAAYRLVIDLVPARPSAGNELPPPAPRQSDATPAGFQNAALPAPLAPRRPQPVPRPWIVVLDPGHGGHDPGAIGVSGVYEKTLTLLTARQVREALEPLGRYRVYLTRNNDRYIPLRKRIAIARAKNADIFISIHADSMRNRGTRGASVYTLSERASDAEAAALAERENMADVINGVDLSGESNEVATILLDLAQRESMNRSARLARLLVTSLARETPILQNPHRFAGFAVLKAPDVPSVLIEMGFLSNRSDEASLKDSHRRGVLANAIARAIHDYFSQTQVARAD